MKYSLKNKQFRKRNNIFGERRKDQIPYDEYNYHLEEIGELAESSEESKVAVEQNKDFKNSKIHKFINYDTTFNQVVAPLKNQQRKNSLQHRPSKHGLSPNTKPVLNIPNNTNLRMTQSRFLQPKPLKMQLRSQVISIHYVGKKKSQSEEELREVIMKIYSIIMKNNSRINQIESLLTLMMQNGKLLIRQTNKGVQKAIRVQQRINLFLNTMRSVYENLRICKLKQQNLQLYIKQQNKEKQNHISTAYEDQTIQKPSKPRYRLDDLKKEMTMSVEDPESKQLISLVDYESNYSQSESMTFQQFKPELKKNSKHQITLSLTEHQIIDKASGLAFFNEQAFKKQFKNEKPPLVPQSNLQWQKLSPFDANRIISSSTHQRKLSRYSHNDSRLKTFHGSNFEEFQTFRTNKNIFQLDTQQQKLKNWLRKLGSKGFKCWLDQMGCLRRPNMTYVFYQNGQVINLSRESFNQLVEQGELIPVFDNK